MSDDDSARVSGIVARLMAATVPGDVVSLDTVGDHIGAAPVSYEEIGEIIDALERSGRTVSDPALDITHALGQVLAAARAARTNGQAPTLLRLQQDTGLDRVTILTALRFADTLKR